MRLIMSDNIRMDSHKLIYHPNEVSRWFNGENVYPIEIEISPSDLCNHRCIFCAVDYTGYSPTFLDKSIILENTKAMRSKGLKSVVCSGEGEPLLNRNMPDIANGMKKQGIDVSMATNGVLLTKELSKECLSAFTWIRFSVASMNNDTYNAVQKGKDGDLKRVKDNLAEAVRIKHLKQLKTTLGVQCLLLPQNIGDIADMAKELKEIGVDYFTIKPYSQHLHSKNHFEIDYTQLLDLETELKEFESEDFKIYFRANAMKKIHKRKNYSKCFGLSFMTHIDAKGNVWPCIAHIGAEDFCYGNIYEQSFCEIWEGNRRLEINKRINSSDLNKVCREACRLDEINKYLYELKNPGDHVNFI